MDPTRIVPIQDYTPATLRAVVAQLEGSTTVDHLVYRESELDALWTLLEREVRLARQNGDSEARVQELHRLFAAAQDAHNLVAAEDPAAAARRLRQVAMA
ncbi:MAG: hypothetical protein HYX51_07685 [Chloroflexi bacterium]|nr:hypothetical protein [Chloroflexota bacterium]